MNKEQLFEELKLLVLEIINIKRRSTQVDKNVERDVALKLSSAWQVRSTQVINLISGLNQSDQNWIDVHYREWARKNLQK